jgi:hypothetical protein
MPNKESDTDATSAAEKSAANGTRAVVESAIDVAKQSTGTWEQLSNQTPGITRWSSTAGARAAAASFSRS